MLDNLSNLNEGQSGRVTSISADEALHHRLSAFGFRAGKLVTVIRQAGFQGPLQVRVGSTDVILRRNDARKVGIKLAL